MHNTGTSSIVYVRYWYYQYCNITILVFLALYSVTTLVLPVLQHSQYWYFQYCEYYNTGNTSIVNITILVIPVARPAASYYPKQIFFSETTGPIATKLWWNDPCMAPFQNCVRWSRFPTKMATKLKIEKKGGEILIVHCCFSISQNELKF